jgi:hypothetical protein
MRLLGMRAARSRQGIRLRDVRKDRSAAAPEVAFPAEHGNLES